MKIIKDKKGGDDLELTLRANKNKFVSCKKSGHIKFKEMCDRIILMLQYEERGELNYVFAGNLPYKYLFERFKLYCLHTIFIFSFCISSLYFNTLYVCYSFYFISFLLNNYFLSKCSSYSAGYIVYK